MKTLLTSLIIATLAIPTAALATLKADSLPSHTALPKDQAINYVVNDKEVCVTFSVDNISESGEACVKKSDNIDKDIKVALSEAKYDLMLKSDF